jgi:hypothetical protein
MPHDLTSYTLKKKEGERGERSERGEREERGAREERERGGIGAMELAF